MGNRTSLSANLPGAPAAYSGTTAYQYDYGQTANPQLNRSQLTQEQGPQTGGYTNVFAYDGGTSTGPGNPTTFRGASRTFNADNQDSANTYDGNGNPDVVRWPMKGRYDPENRLVEVYDSLDGGDYLTCGYTGDGLRAWKQGSAGRTYFLYDGTLPVCELDGTGAVTATNTFGTNGLLSRHTGAGSVFYVFDLSGNVAQRTNANGTSLSADLCDAFGKVTTTASNLDVFGFGGQWGYYTDIETGLVLCTHRFYDPTAGRFLTRDPISYNGGVNLYAYVGNDPVNRADPSGLHWGEPGDPIDGGDGGGGGGGIGGGPVGEDPIGDPIGGMGGGGTTLNGGGGGGDEGGGPGFVVTPGGTTVPIPPGASGPIPTSGASGGQLYNGGLGGGIGQFPDGFGGSTGMDPGVTGVRIMDPTPPKGASPGYPNGYACYMNVMGQTVDPATGNTVPRNSPVAHWPL